MIIPVTLRTDIDGLNYYAVAAPVKIGEDIVYPGNLVDKRNITFTTAFIVRVPLETKEGRYANLSSALFQLGKLPEGANCLLFDENDLASLLLKKEIFGTPCVLNKLEISSLRRLRK